MTGGIYVKRFLCLVLAVALCLSLSSCSPAQPTPRTTTPTPTPEPTFEETTVDRFRDGVKSYAYMAQYFTDAYGEPTTDSDGIKRWEISNGTFYGKPVTKIRLDPSKRVTDRKTGESYKTGHWYMYLGGESLEPNKENIVSAVYDVLDWFGQLEKPLLFAGATITKSGYEWRKPYERVDVEAFADNVLSDSVGILSYKKGFITIEAWFRPDSLNIHIEILYIDN